MGKDDLSGFSRPSGTNKNVRVSPGTPQVQLARLQVSTFRRRLLADLGMVRWLNEGN
jgi:hypothetical protein